MEGMVVKRMARILMDCWVYLSRAPRSASRGLARSKGRQAHRDVKQKLLIGITLEPLVTSALQQVTDSVTSILVEALDLLGVDGAVERGLREDRNGKSKVARRERQRMREVRCQRDIHGAGKGATGLTKPSKPFSVGPPEPPAAGACLRTSASSSPGLAPFICRGQACSAGLHPESPARRRLDEPHRPCSCPGFVRIILVRAAQWKLKPELTFKTVKVGIAETEK